LYSKTKFEILEEVQNEQQEMSGKIVDAKKYLSREAHRPHEGDRTMVFFNWPPFCKYWFMGPAGAVFCLQPLKRYTAGDVFRGWRERNPEDG
jgi:hypothetical protein